MSSSSLRSKFVRFPSDLTDLDDAMTTGDSERPDGKQGEFRYLERESVCLFVCVDLDLHISIILYFSRSTYQYYTVFL